MSRESKESVEYIQPRSEISIIIWPPNINISYLRVHPRSPSRIVEALLSKERQVVEEYILKILICRETNGQVDAKRTMWDYRNE